MVKFCPNRGEVMVIDIEADMSDLFAKWHNEAHRFRHDVTDCRQSFYAGWGEALLYAATAREMERRAAVPEGGTDD